MAEMTAEAKAARRESQRRWYAAHAEERRSYRRQWYAANKEKRQEYMARYWQKKADQMVAASSEPAGKDPAA